MTDPESTEFIEAFAGDVREGLSSKPKFLLAKYFYDEEGSKLFEEITHLSEYYPTRTEASILGRERGSHPGRPGGRHQLGGAGER